jgi:hypothetical protein
MWCDHEKVKLDCPYFWESDRPIPCPRIPVDIELAPLMPLIWAYGINAKLCCQERFPGIAEIDFPCAYEVSEFLTVAQREYEVVVETSDEIEDDGRHNYSVRLMVRFPTSDIPALVDAFKAEIKSTGRGNGQAG